MRLFIATFIFSFLSSGNLQYVNKGQIPNKYQQQPYVPKPGAVPVVEEHIWPVQAYQTFRGNFYGTARRSLGGKPCDRNDNSQNLDQINGIITFEQPANNQLRPSPTRRSQIVTLKKSSIDSINVPPQMYKDEGPLLRTQNQILKDDDSNMLVSQDIQEDEPESFRIKTQIIKDSASNTLKTQPQDLKNEDTIPLEIQPEVSSDEGPSTVGKNTQIINNEQSNTFRMAPQITRNDGSLNIQPNIIKKYGSIHDQTFTIQPLHINDRVDLVSRQSESIDDDESSNSSSDDISGPEDYAISAPEFKPKKVESDNSKENIVSTSRPLSSDPQIARSRVLCSKKKGAVLKAPAQRRFLVSNKDYLRRMPNAERNEVILSNNIGDQSKQNEVSSQSLDTSTLNGDTKGISDNSNEHDDTKAAHISTDENPEKTVQRAGNTRYVMNSRNDAVKDPTKGQGIKYVKKTTLMLMGYDRVCYACSTANSPTCKNPNRRTGVKYCKKGDNACVTKTFGSGSTLTLIRDCAKSCEDSAPGLAPNYKSCGICHSDLCNSAYSINVETLILTLSSSVIIVLVRLLL